MVEENKSKKTQKTITAQTESEEVKQVRGNYTGYFYNQIDRLWQEVMFLQAENVQLKAQIKGEY